MKITSAIAMIGLALTLSIGGDKVFPVLEGEKLTGETIIIPKYLQGKLSIVGMAYSKKSEVMLKTWYEPMYNKFILKRGMFDSNYDVNMLFIPMYTGAKKAAYQVSINKMKESNRKDLYPYLLFYKGSLEPYVSELRMENKALPYLFVLDEQGNIITSVKGFFSDAKMEQIETALDNRMN